MTLLFRRRCVLRLLGLLPVLAAGPAMADDWISHGVDPGHTRLSAERSGAAFRAGGWTYALPAEIATVSSPAIADGVVVFGAFDGVVRALRAADGQLLWQQKLSNTIYAAPAIHRGKVFVPALDRKLYAFRLSDGSVAWTKELGGLEMASPVIAGDALIVSAGFPLRKIVKVDAITGETLWVSPSDVLAQFSNTAAAVSADQVIVGANGGHYYSFDLATGALRWSYEASGIVNLSAPVIVGNSAFMLPGGASRKLHGVDLATGLPLDGWPIELPASDPDVAGTVQSRQLAVSSLAAAGGLLLFDTRFDDSIDTNKDFVADTFLMREAVVAVDIASGTLRWTQANGRRVATDENAVPKFWLCPTPAVFQTADGPMVAVSSSTSSLARVLELTSGETRWSATTAGGSQLSPAFANGRLFLGGGSSLTSLLSSANQPPEVPRLLGDDGRQVGHITPMVRWGAGADPDRDPVSFQLRIDHDNEVLETWEQELTIAAGQTSARLPFNLKPGMTYTLALRARDSKGAWSDWSLPQTLAATSTPAVRVDGTAAVDLLSALQTARPGSVIKLGAGTFNLTEGLRITGGVTVTGEGAGRTILSARGLGAAVTLDGNVSGQPSQLSRVTVADATVGVLVRDSKDALLKNLIVRDNSEAGIEISASGSAQLVNGTLISNGKAIKAFGPIAARNSILNRNQFAFWSPDANVITSKFNDLFGNVTNFHQTESGLGDLGATLTWADQTARDFHLLAPQASTDRGDPADDFSAEPLPNGGRINLGAFGGTAEAELSAAEDPPAPPAGQAGGCAVAAAASGSQHHPMSLEFAVLAAAVVIASARRRRR